MMEEKMRQTIEAIYDGAVFRPTVPVTLKPNTRVRVTVARDEGTTAPGVSFLDTASSLNLDGPADWAANIEDYLHGRPDERAA
jgi:predicted DNA-binding antitoxin AbrB/MazE fold protein